MARLIILLSIILLPTRPLSAETFRVAIASNDDLYIADILRLALKAQDGNHSVEVLRVPPMAQGRALRALADGRAAYNVLYSGYSVEREQELTMVNFPLTRGLLGYRVLAIRQDRKRLTPDEVFQTQKGQACFGSGSDWPDTLILRQAGLCVVTAADENLWPMLLRGRFQAFPRSLIEVMSELNALPRTADDGVPTLDPNIMLAYRQDLFFFMPRKASKQAGIIEGGLKKMHADGTYDKYFYSIPTIKLALEELIQQPRTVIHLESPPKFTSLNEIPDQYWYNFDDASTFAENIRD